MFLFASVCCNRRSGGLALRKRWAFGFSYTLVLHGLTKTLNLLLLEFPFICLGSSLGWSANSETRWWKLVVPCQRCQKYVTYKSGIICANFGYTRGTFNPCKGAWCADCFLLTTWIDLRPQYLEILMVPLWRELRTK